MTRVLIWDLPTRLFHWLMVAGFFAAAGIAFLLEDEGGLFPYHAIFGLTLAGMVILRLVWGVVGSRYARFRSFAFGPGAVVGYVRGVVTRTGTRHIGHNPASAYAIFAILALVLAQATTGVLLATGTDAVKELHEIIAYALLVVVGVHIAGVILHTLRHRENITASMIHGRKQAEPEQAIGSSRPLVALLFLVLAGGWFGALISSYDATTQTAKIPVLNTTLTLGDEGNEAERGEGDHRERHEDDD